MERPERQSTWLELFFDLVFVAGVAALATQLHADHSLKGLAVFAGLFVPVWWGWWGYTWFSAGFDNGDKSQRLAILVAMVAIAGVAAGVHGAAHGRSTTFVIAYAGFFYVLAVLFARAWRTIPEARRLTARYAIGNTVGASLWLGSLGLDETVRPFAWVLAMVVLMSSPVLAARSLPFLSDDRRHIAERYGLFTLIVLGESVVVSDAGLDTGSGFAGVLTAMLGFVIAATIWWVYFDRWRSMPAVGLAAGWVWPKGICSSLPASLRPRWGSTSWSRRRHPAALRCWWIASP